MYIFYCFFINHTDLCQKVFWKRFSLFLFVNNAFWSTFCQFLPFFPRKTYEGSQWGLWRDFFLISKLNRIKFFYKFFFLKFSPDIPLSFASAKNDRKRHTPILIATVSNYIDKTVSTCPFFSNL